MQLSDYLYLNDIARKEVCKAYSYGRKYDKIEQNRER